MSDAEDAVVPAIVIDNGTEMIKAGFGGEYAPRSIFPTIVGRPRQKGIMIGMVQKDVYAGHEAQAKRGILQIQYPIKQGIIDSFIDMEYVWRNVFDYELLLQSEDFPVLLTEKALNPKSNRMKTAEIMFEKFNVPSMCLINQSVSALLATARTTGIVLDFGCNSIECVPIYQGYALKDYVNKINVGGRDIIDIFRDKITKAGRGWYVNKYRDNAKEIVHKMGYVAVDYEKEIAKNIEESFEIMGLGLMQTIKNEIFECYEILFNGRHNNGFGIHKMIQDSVKKCGLNQWELCQNIVMNGGMSIVDGLMQRLQDELIGLFPGNDEILINGYLRNLIGTKMYKDIGNMIYNYAVPVSGCNIISVPQSKYLSWIGGSIFTKTDLFEDSCVTKKEYEEIGARVVNRNCF